MRDAWCRVSIRQIRYYKSAAWRLRIGRIWILLTIGVDWIGLSFVQHPARSGKTAVSPTVSMSWRRSKNHPALKPIRWRVSSNCATGSWSRGVIWVSSARRKTSRFWERKSSTSVATGRRRDADAGKYDRNVDADQGESVRHHYRHLRRCRRDHAKRRIGGGIVPGRIRTARRGTASAAATTQQIANWKIRNNKIKIVKNHLMNRQSQQLFILRSFKMIYI